MLLLLLVLAAALIRTHASDSRCDGNSKRIFIPSLCDEKSSLRISNGCVTVVQTCHAANSIVTRVFGRLKVPRQQRGRRITPGVVRPQGGQGSCTWRTCAIIRISAWRSSEFSTGATKSLESTGQTASGYPWQARSIAGSRR